MSISKINKNINGLKGNIIIFNPKNVIFIYPSEKLAPNNFNLISINFK
jgi:hypothetical protein